MLWCLSLQSLVFGSMWSQLTATAWFPRRGQSSLFLHKPSGKANPGGGAGPTFWGLWIPPWEALSHSFFSLWPLPTFLFFQIQMLSPMELPRGGGTASTRCPWMVPWAARADGSPRRPGTVSGSRDHGFLPGVVVGALVSETALHTLVPGPA